MSTVEMATLGLAPVFSPSQAAEILRDLGLEGITECALRTRAYRKQVPFHLNGRRITFTVSDLREIAEGQACHPQPQTRADNPEPAVSPRPRRRRAPAAASATNPGPWRARRTRDA
jgi:hypothetical protein